MTKCLSDIQWLWVSHLRVVGGVTKCRGTFGVNYWCPSLDLPIDLKRSLGHIVKYSVRPKPVNLPFHETHYTADGHLFLPFILRPIVYSTRTTASGWSVRALADDELSSCFELSPDYVKWNDRFATDIIPIQMFRSVIDLVLHRLCPQSPDQSKRSRIRSQSPAGESAEPDGVWQENVNCWLPGSWTEAQIADIAVKSDDAEVDFAPCHRRISVVFPCSTRHLRTIESLLTPRRWQSNVVMSFFSS